MVHKPISGLFAFAWMFVMIVSVVDGYLVLQCRDVIGDFERNPAGIALLAITGGQVWLFLSLKFLGTSLACMWLLIIFGKNPRLGVAITLSIASFQFGLLIFLQYAGRDLVFLEL